MVIVRSKNDVPIRLTDERGEHIVSRHPEMSGEWDRVLETVQRPDYIQEGDFGELLAVRHYAATAMGAKHVVVAYREVGPDDGYVITAYLTNRPSDRRRIIWKP